MARKALIEKVIKSLVWSRPTAMRGEAISSGERKIILNVFKHFKTENSSLNENAVITQTLKSSEDCQT